MSILIKKRGDITAKVLADSISKDNVRITTFRLHYPRFIHAEFMTHRLFSRNASSSRAIPVDQMIKQVLDTPARPISWGVNQRGMQSEKEFSAKESEIINKVWSDASISATSVAEELMELKLHKQFANRILEPFQFMNVICTATEYDNFFELRRHKDAQPEIQELANGMFEAREKSEPMKLEYGEWHLPFISISRDNSTGKLIYGDFGSDFDLARKVSASCCAQVSYRKEDHSIEKAERIFNQLIESKPMHASPIEHQATPMPKLVATNLDDLKITEGITHLDKNHNLWSANLRGWVQYRHLVQAD